MDQGNADLPPSSVAADEERLTFEDAVAFLDELAPDSTCSICGNDTVTLFVQNPKDAISIPSEPFLSLRSGHLTYAMHAFFTCCDRCGHVAKFLTKPALDWKRKKAASGE